MCAVITLLLLAEAKSGKGIIESEGFMNALSTQAAKMKEKKIKRVPKIPKHSRNNSGSDPITEVKQDMPTEEGNEANMEGECGSCWRRGGGWKDEQGVNHREAPGA